MPKRRPLLRATAELLNAANGLQPLAREGYPTIPVFAFGWPTSELSPLYMAGSMLDAVRRGIRGDFGGPRGRIALALTAVSWAVLYLIHRRNVAAQPHFEDPLREALGADYQDIAEKAKSTRRRYIGVRPAPCSTGRCGSTGPTSGAAPTYRATAKPLCCCRSRAAHGRSGCANRRPTHC